MPLLSLSFSGRVFPIVNGIIVLFLSVLNEESSSKANEPSLANGYIILNEINNQNIYALYTCYHAEPESIEFIHALKNELLKITYVHREADKWLGGGNLFYSCIK